MVEDFEQLVVKPEPNTARSEGRSITELKKSLRDPDPAIRRAAAKTLAEYGSRAADAVYVLADTALNDLDTQVQELSCRAIGKLGEAAVAGLPALAQLLRTGDEPQRIAATSTLFSIAEVAIMCRPALVQALNDASQDVRRYAAQALERMNGDLRYA